jgi:hypothetical protein
MMSPEFSEDDVIVDRTYPFELAPGIVTTARVTFERTVNGVRFVRYTGYGLGKLPGYCRIDLFANAVRRALEYL